MKGRACWVRVPGSTSNLGPGFDVLGMAVDLFLEARFVPGGDHLALERTGTVAEIPEPMETDLCLQTFREALGGEPPPGRLLVSSQVPVGRGLGSSAAARVAGWVLGRLVAGETVDRMEAVARAAEGEGHPDNAAPAVLGGLVAAWRGGPGGVRVSPLPVSGRLGWVYVAPGVSLSTDRARAALPERLDHAAAVRNTARLALLIPALGAGDGPALSVAMEDELHVPFRLPLIPGAVEARTAGGDAGAWAVSLSGAGSGLVAVTRPGEEEVVGRAMAAAFQAVAAARGATYHVVHPWAAGTTWGWGEPTPPGPVRLATSPG